MKLNRAIRRMFGLSESWDFDNPDDCRDFLKSVRIGTGSGRRITFLQDATGRQLSIDEASDQQVQQVCGEVLDALKAAR